MGIKRKENKNEDSSKRLVKTLTILVIMYTICTLPLTILQLYMWMMDGTTIGGDSFRWLWFLASFLYLAQSAMNIFIYHRSKEFSEALKNLYGVKKSSLVYSSSNYRNTLRTNLTSKVRIFKQQTLTTSDGCGHRISTLHTDSTGLPSSDSSKNMIHNSNINNPTSPNNARVFIDKGHIISKLDTSQLNNLVASRNADRLAVYNMDIESTDYVSPPPKIEEDFEKIMPTAILRPISPVIVETETQQQQGQNNNNFDRVSIGSSNNGHE